MLNQFSRYRFKVHVYMHRKPTFTNQLFTGCANIGLCQPWQRVKKVVSFTGIGSLRVES